MCASVSPFAFLWLTGPLPLSLPCPLYRFSEHSDTHDPMCGKRWRRSGSTKELTAINFGQVTFTIIQRDSRLIALTLSLQWACLSQRSPFLVNTKEPSYFAFIREAERLLEEVWVWTVEFLFFAALFFPLLIFIFLSIVISILYRKIKRHVRESYWWQLWCRFIFLKENQEYCSLSAVSLQLAGGRHFATKAENELLCAPKTECIRTAEVMEKQLLCQNIICLTFFRKNLHATAVHKKEY